MLLSRKIFTGAAFTLAAAVISSTFISAQDAPAKNPAAAASDAPNAPAQDPAGPNPAGQKAPGQTFRAKQIIGSKVNIQGDAAVGTVDDIVLDDHGNVDYLIVAKEDASLVTVPWDAAVFNADQRVATVQITPQRFQQVPTYTVKQYPLFARPAYRTQVYGYYGVTPGQERRAVRRGDVVVPANN